MATDPSIRPQTTEINQGFFDGRQFRMFLELSIPKGGTVWMRFVAKSNFILYDQRISMLSGEVRWSAVEEPTSEPGPWTPATIRRRNEMIGQPQPIYYSTSKVETSTAAGAVVGGVEVDVMRASSTGPTTTQNAGPRGLAPSVYYVKITNPSKTDAVGVYDWWWEERP